MRRCTLQAKNSPVDWKTRVRRGVQRLVRQYVPDPRDAPLTELPMSADAYKRTYLQQEGGVRVGMRPGQSVEDYMAERDQKWLEAQRITTSRLVNEQKLHTTADGQLFTGTGTREAYMDVEHANRLVKSPKPSDYEADEELVLMRRQLQVENEAEYRKFIAESKRSEMTMGETQKRRRPHPSDPTYDPFKICPGYRPQDSVALAQWLKRQRESGKTASGLSLQTKEGQERFYNEEKMATQFHANPFSARVEEPRGMTKMRITAYSPDSIFVNDKEVIGSCIVTDKAYYHWNISSFEEVNERTMALLLHLYPVPDVIFLGTGRNLHFIDEELRIAFQKRGSVIHCLTTPQACGHFGVQLSVSRRAALAVINPVPTNGYGVECFGDFIENDMFSLSDTQLGVPPIKQFSSTMFKPNKVAEKYRHMQGTGFGPKYHQMSDGRLVRPGTSGTKLRPLLEPGEEVQWEQLPSYYHWYPKEHLHDYIENTTMREIQGKPTGDPLEKRLYQAMRGGKSEKDETPSPELAPWDSASIPITKFPHERNEEEIVVEDPKTGRIIGMDRDTYERWRVMMQERREGKPESDPVEYDQERFVTNKDGVVFDLSKMKYRPIFEGRWNPRRPQSTGRTNPIMT
ncbi:uncharacterized protein TM35_000064610 [Trypanosoma theileri]|uniref:NADH dehydrogenase [ubiquinone] 1 alpha subcomplex assembly factor 3 n=1 Tax=Trypanosoma theileri TaxID=67003 RepID=A0A1X0P3D3_9TRYP|nr:uncharacterized protein TM35_000064610 [Trypanosoma theileri]ORC91456.1 hypothetical protein TM35_000064610 [Trypanosoma theileri]